MTRQEFIRTIQAAQRGDRRHFAALYDEYFGKLFATAFHIVRDRDAAYDIASDVVLKLMHFRGDASSIENHVGYMITMVRNRAKDYIGKKKREVPSGDIPLRNEAAASDMLWLDDILMILAEDEKDTFFLHYVWDLPLRKVAERINLTYGAVKARKVKISRKLKALYREKQK